MPQFGTFTREVDIVGGQTLTVAFWHGQPVQVEDDDVKIIIAGLRPVGRDLFQLFSFQVKKGQLPRRVTIEDVAGDTRELFVDDLHPKFHVNPKKPDEKTNVWSWVSPPLSYRNWKPQWIHEPDDSVRVYRFTIVTADGRKLVEDQAVQYPFVIKQLIVRTLGTEAPKKDESVEPVEM
jgi:hypothetical protein